MMKCSHSKAPKDVELLAFALEDDPLDDETRIHLEQCETCQRRLAEYRHLNSSLVTKLYRSQCPSGTELNYYGAEMLPQVQKMRIAAHVQDCPLCTAEMMQIRTLLCDFEPFPVDERELTFSPVAAVRRIFATLVRQQAQLVLRGSGDLSESAWPRQYHAEDIDLSLHLSRASSGEHVLLGIITSTDATANVDTFEGLATELYPAAKSTGTGDEKRFEEVLASTQIDDLGNFVFNAVPVGEYVLVIHLPEREVVIDGLIIKYS